MSTSLSKQLKRLALPQSQIYTQIQRQASLLFDSSVAATHDRETVFALGVTGFDELVNIEPSFAQFKDTLFSEASIGVERAMLTRERNADLDNAIRHFLALLVPYVPIRSSHKALEWLIYRFQVHNYNAELVLRSVIAYFDTNIFLRILQILQIKDTDPAWYWLVRYQKSETGPDRASLLKQCSNNASFLAVVTELIPDCIEVIEADRVGSLQVLYSFCSSILVGFLDSCKVVTETAASKIMSFNFRGLKSKNADFAMCAYMVIAQLAVKCTLLPAACQMLVENILTHLTEKLAPAAVTTVIVLCQTQTLEMVPSQVFKKIVKRKQETLIIENVAKLSETTNVGKFMAVFVSNLFERATGDASSVEAFDAGYCQFLKRCLSQWPLNPDLASMAFRTLLQKLAVAFEHGESKAAFERHFEETVRRLARRYPVAYDMVIVRSAKKHSVSDEVLQEFTAMSGTDTVQEGGGQTNLLLSLLHPTWKVRQLALKKVFDLFRSGFSLEKLREDFGPAVLKRFDDPDAHCLSLLLQNTDAVVELCGLEATFDALVSVYQRAEKQLVHKKWSALLDTVTMSLPNFWGQLQEQRKTLAFKMIVCQLVVRSDDRADFCLQLSNCNPLSVTCLTSFLCNDYVEKLKQSERKSVAVLNSCLIGGLRDWLLAVDQDVFKDRLKAFEPATVLDEVSVKQLLLDTAVLSSCLLSLPVEAAASETASLLTRTIQSCVTLLRRLKLLSYEVDVHSVFQRGEMMADGVVSAFSCLLTTADPDVVPAEAILLADMTVCRFTFVKQELMAKDWWSTPSCASAVGTLADVLRFVFSRLHAEQSDLQLSQAALWNIIRTCFSDVTGFFKLLGRFLSVDTPEADVNSLLVPFLGVVKKVITFLPKVRLSALASKALPVVPVLLVSCNHSNRKVRIETLLILEALANGASSKSLFLPLLKHVCTFSEEIIADRSFVEHALAAYFCADQAMTNFRTPKRQKKSNDASVFNAFCDGVVAGVLSDVGDLDNFPVDIAIAFFSCLNEARRKEFLHCCLPSLSKLLDHLTSVTDEAIVETLEMLAALLLRQYSADVASRLAVEDSDEYLVLTRSLKSTYPLFCAALSQLTADFFQAADVAVQNHLAKFLCEFYVGCQSPERAMFAADAKAALFKLPLKTETLSLLLNDVIDSSNPSKSSVVNDEEPSDEAPSSAASQTAVSFTDRQWKMLMLVLEVIGTNTTVSCSKHLLKLLFAVLRNCSRIEDKQRREYGDEVTMSCLSSVLRRYDGKELSAADFDIDTVVLLIRRSTSTGVHQHALHLLTVATALFKEELIVRLMPIFTFMGNKMFRRDDSYSFHLMGRTIETVIPSIMAVYKDDTTGQSGEKVALKVLADFAVSTPYIPEHRRLKILVKLLNCLQPVNQPATSPVAASFVSGNRFLWIMMALLLDYHVTHWHRDCQSPDQAAQSPANMSEFAVRLCLEFRPAEQVACLTWLLEYVTFLPDSTDSPVDEPETMTTSNFAEVFSVKNHTLKQLKHFKYEVLGIVGEILADHDFVQKLSDESDSAPVVVLRRFEALLQQVFHCLRWSNEALAKSSPFEERYWKSMIHRSKACLEKVNALLPADITLNLIGRLVAADSLQIKRYAMEMLNDKLTEKPPCFGPSHTDSLVQLADTLAKLIDVNNRDKELVLVSQGALLTMKLLVRVVGSNGTVVFGQVLDRVVHVLELWVDTDKYLVSNAVLCLADLIRVLGPGTIAQMATYVPCLVAILDSDDYRTDLVVISVLTALDSFMTILGLFATPYLTSLITTIGCKVSGSRAASRQYVGQVSTKKTSIKKSFAHLPARMILPAVKRVVEDTEPNAFLFAINVLKEYLSFTDSKEVSASVSQFVDIFAEALDVQYKFSQNHMTQGELEHFQLEVADCFVALAMKLSENSLKPLLGQLIDWSSSDESRRRRTITIFVLGKRLADRFCILFVVFAHGFVKVASELLNQCNASRGESRYFREEADSDQLGKTLLTVLLDFLETCFKHDSHQVVSRQWFDVLLQPLVDQFDKLDMLEYESVVTDHVIPCLLSLADAVADDSSWKSLNYQILLKTRHSDKKVRFLCLRFLELLYEQIGDDINSIVPDSIPFIAELIEDESEEVEGQCHKVIAVIEKTLGEKIDKFL